MQAVIAYPVAQIDSVSHHRNDAPAMLVKHDSPQQQRLGTCRQGLCRAAKWPASVAMTIMAQMIAQPVLPYCAVDRGLMQAPNVEEDSNMISTEF